MGKLTLTSAIEIYKKIKSTKFLQLTEKAIGKFIDDQISTKRDEIQVLKDETVETTEELTDDFQISLMDLDESNIKSTGARKETAQEYVLDALLSLREIDDFKVNQKTLIDHKESQIKQLETLRDYLEKLADNIVIEEEA